MSPLLPYGTPSLSSMLTHVVLHIKLPAAVWMCFAA